MTLDCLITTGGLAITSLGHPRSLSPDLLCSSCSGTAGLHPLMLCLAVTPSSWLAFLCRAAALACSLTATAQLGQGEGPEPAAEIQMWLLAAVPHQAYPPDPRPRSCAVSELHRDFCRAGESLQRKITEKDGWRLVRAITACRCTQGPEFISKCTKETAAQSFCTIPRYCYTVWCFWV